MFNYLMWSSADVHPISSSRFLDLAAEGNAEKLDKHRFLVQSKALEGGDTIKRDEKISQYQLVQMTSFHESKLSPKLKEEKRYVVQAISSRGNIC